MKSNIEVLAVEILDGIPVPVVAVVHTPNYDEYNMLICPAVALANPALQVEDVMFHAVMN